MARNKSEDVSQEKDTSEIFSQELISKFIFECIMNKYSPTTEEECTRIIEKKRINSRIIEDKGIQYLTICAWVTKVIWQKPAYMFLNMLTEEKWLETLQTLKQFINNSEEQWRLESKDLSPESAIPLMNKSLNQSDWAKAKSKIASNKQKKSQTLLSEPMVSQVA